MAIPKLLLALLLAAACAAGPAAAATAASMDPAELVLQAENQNLTAMLEDAGAQGFVYNPTLLTGAAATAAVKKFGAAGSSTSRMAEQFPALAGFGISQTYFELAPCAHRAPHTHLRASGLLYVIEAATLEVGFVLEDASASVVNNVSTGASAVFPQGLLHYQQNRDCKNVAKYTISYNADNPGTVNQAQALFALPTEVVAAALDQTATETDALLKALPKKNIYAGAIGTSSQCVAACAAAGVAVGVQGNTVGSTPLPAVLQEAAAQTTPAPAPAPAPAAPAPQAASRSVAMSVAAAAAATAAAIVVGL